MQLAGGRWARATDVLDPQINGRRRTDQHRPGADHAVVGVETAFEDVVVDIGGQHQPVIARQAIGHRHLLRGVIPCPGGHTAVAAEHAQADGAGAQRAVGRQPQLVIPEAAIGGGVAAVVHMPAHGHRAPAGGGGRHAGKAGHQVSVVGGEQHGAQRAGVVSAVVGLGIGAEGVSQQGQVVVAVQPGRHADAGVDVVTGTGGQRAVVGQAGQHDVVAIADHRIAAEDHPVNPGGGGGRQRAGVGDGKAHRHGVAAALGRWRGEAARHQVRIGFERHGLHHGRIVVALIAFGDQRRASGVLVHRDHHPQIAHRAQAVGDAHAKAALHGPACGQRSAGGGHRVVGHIHIDQVLTGGRVDDLHPVEPALRRGRVARVVHRPLQVEHVAGDRRGIAHLQVADRQVGRTGELE